MKSRESVEHFLSSYGDLLFDLCESVLIDHTSAQLAFRSILKELKRKHRSNRYEKYERAWVLGVATRRLRNLVPRFGTKLSNYDQIKLDSDQDSGHKLKRIDAYFQRLQPEDQFLLLLKDKFQIPYPEISAALGSPEASLKIRRNQALRALEEWVWEHA